MSTLIQAKRVKKRWLDWARESLQQKDHVEILDAGPVLQKLRELKSTHPESLSYELSNLSLTDASSSVIGGSKRLGIELVICVVGDPLEPAVLHLTTDDLDPILRESAQTEKTISLAPAALDGLLVVDMPEILTTSEFLVSGCGSMEKLVEEIQRELPGGALFRGN